jgi:cation diffusion facilitator family transporter
MSTSSLTRYAWLSIGAAVLTIALKTIAYALTGSVGLLSDALESIVNLAGGLMALTMLSVAARPADEGHAFGHNKAEYFSSGVEGMLILVAAASIATAAIQRLIDPQPLEQAGLGLAVSLIASLINLGAALTLAKAGRRYHSITLEANSQHLLTDVWTSAGVLVGVGAVVLTGWQRLDPVVALLVAANIVWAGVRIVRKSILGLMDSALSQEEQEQIKSIIETHQDQGIRYHALLTRQSGMRKFVSVHILVPGEWTVQQGHNLVDRIETDICAALPNTTVFTHLESLSDPASWHDISLERDCGSRPTLSNPNPRDPENEPEPPDPQAGPQTGA